MRTLILALIPGLLLACGGDETTTITTSESTGASTGTGEPTTGSPSDPSNPSDPSDPSNVSDATNPSDPSSATTTPMTTPTSVSSDATSDPTVPDPTTGGDLTTTTDTTTGDTMGDTTTTGDTTTNGGGLCGADGPVVAAELVHVGQPSQCGALEFAGQNQAGGPGPIYALDGCPCGANCLKPDPWTFSIDVPAEWQPGILPACPRIVVERQMSKAGCELVGLAIWDAQEPDDAPAIYHAGSLQGPIAAAAGELTLESVAVEECDCDDCCGVPTRFDLSFGALATMATIPEGETGKLGTDKFGYDVANFQSHVSGICDDSPAIDWVARRHGKL